ncbi:hypothetical protein D5086_018691 [Populus alba]|uniref:Uncharacterized protein n=1 Tax=Populus alba TaxID=43335 RepID=A0ACC4BR23_POPAL
MEGKVLKPSRFKRVCVFCGSSTGKRKCYRDAANELGQELVAKRLDLVYGGGSIGLMGLVSQAVHSGGGNVLGIIPRTLMSKEITGETVGEVKPVADMHQRKAEMARNSDCFIALPGGYGTLEELLEVTTWAQLGIHDKPEYVPVLDGVIAKASWEIERQQSPQQQQQQELPSYLVQLLDKFPVDGMGQLETCERSQPFCLSGPKKTWKALAWITQRSVSRSIIRPRFWGNVTVVGNRFKFFAVCACHFGLLLLSKLVQSLQRQDDHDAETGSNSSGDHDIAAGPSLGKLERRPGKGDVYETRVNYRLEREEGSKFSQYANPQNCL